MSDKSAEPDTELRKIWDIPTRLFHWVLVGVVCYGWYLGEYGPFIKTWHFYCGYAVGILVLLRIIWGFIGAPASRFKSFAYGPRAFFAYAGHLFARRPSHWPGHNPMGGLAVFGMLALLAVQVITGLCADDDINAGPLVPYIDSSLSGFLTNIHYWNSRLLLVVVGLHVVIIAFYWIWKRENLVWPMISGRKKVKQSTEA